MLILKIKRMMSVDETAITNILRAMATPIAEVDHNPAAVVSPFGIFLSSRKIIPAPINPNPVATADKTLEIADLSSDKCAATDTNRHEATQMQANVRMPVFCCSLSRSTPTIPPSRTASNNLAESKVQIEYPFRFRLMINNDNLTFHNKSRFEASSEYLFPRSFPIC